MRSKLPLILLLFLLSAQALAAKDPIAWSLNNNFENPVIPGRSYTITYTITSQLPAQMTKALVVTKNASPASDFSYTDNCNGLKLTPNQSCTVQVTLTPSSNGNKTLQLVLSGYDNNQLLIPMQSTLAQGQTTASVYGTVITPLPTTTTAGVTQNYKFSFTNSGSSALSNVSIAVTQTSGTPSYTTTCTSSLSGNNGTCYVTGQYTPASGISVQTVNAQLNYGQGSSTSAYTSSNVSSNTGVVASFVGNNSLPAEMVAGTQTIHVLFTNYGPSNVTMGPNPTPMVVTVGGSVGSINVTTNNCINAILNAGNPAPACDIQGTFTATTPGAPTPVTVQTTASYSGGSSPSTSIDTSTTVVSSISSSRTFTFVNNCNFDVWFSLNGGAPPSSPSCNTNADCNQGSGNTNQSCDTTNHSCYWTNYAPNGPGSSTGTNPSAYKLDSTSTPGGVTTNTITIQSNSLDPSVLWSGNISASLNCSGSSCQIADCGNNGGLSACAPGKGFSQPATQAEFTLLKNNSDSYDVEVINGFTIPISMAPGPYKNVNGYTCGTPGDPIAENGFGACDWTTAVVPTQQNTYTGNGYYTVSSGGTGCDITTGKTTTGGNCPAGTVCGLDSSFNQSCGNFLGYWTADQVCGSSNVPSPVSSYFQCTTSLPSLNSSLGFPTGSTLYQLMACSVPKGDSNTLYNSCYLNYSGLPANNQINCCGCIDWWTVGVNANSTAQSCTKPSQSSPQTDPVWNQYLQSGVQWMKKACPSAYTYPFDDATSGFSCSSSLPGQANAVGYTITFCPGNTGKPSGINDGR